MLTNPGRTMEKLERMLNAWNALAPASRFGGLERQEFDNLVAASRSARATIRNLESQLKEAAALRDLSDEVALAKARMIKNGVLADPEAGENSALYQAMGYVRKDDKKSGLTRKYTARNEPG